MISSMQATVLRVLGSALVLVACSGGPGSSEGPAGSSSGSTTSTPTPAPEQTQTPTSEARVAPPSTKLEVTATIISATLGEDCGGSRGAFAGDCAPAEDGGTCGFVCQQSNLQLSFTSGAGEPAKVEIVEVTLHDATTGNQVDTLTASSPKAWTGSSYAAWNETLSASAVVKATYDLSGPKWSTIGDGNRFSSQYRIRVALRIDGVLVTLESAALNREPNVAT
jgi:hypothetical protein